jgi:3-isopropylmalate/(R)-2-methylmalate dehydratase small subunit
VKAKSVPKGAVIAGGKNFGCGSSREQAASCLKGWGVVVVARSFARIFLQNAINLGLNVVVAPGFAADEGDEIVFEGGGVENRTKRTAFDVVPLPRARQAIIDAGGLIPYTRARLVARA